MGSKVRQVVVYKDYFQSFFAQQDRKVQDKIIKILDIIEQLERVPESYLKYLSETDGLYEIRGQLGRRIFRIFCFFDGERVVILLCGFQKKTKTNRMDIKTLDQIKDQFYGPEGTPERDRIENELQALRIGLKIRTAREKLCLTQEELAQRVGKKRSFISKVENDGGNITLKTLYEIVEHGLGRKLHVEVV